MEKAGARDAPTEEADEPEYSPPGQRSEGEQPENVHWRFRMFEKIRDMQRDAYGQLLLAF